MSNYVDNSYYENNYLQGREAVIPSTSFNFYGLKATNEIRSRIHDGIIIIDEDIKNCACELAEFFYREDMEQKGIAEASAKGVSSERVGEYSVSYSTSNSSEQWLQNREVKITTIMRNWLGHKGLMNRGVTLVY